MKMSLRRVALGVIFLAVVSVVLVGLMARLAYEKLGLKSCCYRLSAAIYTQFIQFVGLAAKVCGYEPEVKGMSDTPEGVFAHEGDTAKQDALGFAHSISFKDGVKRAVVYDEAVKV
jgi:hypothetical protein